MTSFVGSLFGGSAKKKAAKQNAEQLAIQKRSQNSAAEEAQRVAAEQQAEGVRNSKQGRRQLYFDKTGALGVNSKVG